MRLIRQSLSLFYIIRGRKYYYVLADILIVIFSLIFAESRQSVMLTFAPFSSKSLEAATPLLPIPTTVTFLPLKSIFFSAALRWLRLKGLKLPPQSKTLLLPLIRIAPATENDDAKAQLKKCVFFST